MGAARERRPAVRLIRDYEAVWNAMPNPCMVLDAQNRFVAANASAELYLSHSAESLARRGLGDLVGATSRLAELVAQARRGASLSEYGVELGLAEHEPAIVDVQAAPIHLEPETPGAVLVIIQPRSVAAAMNRSLATHGSARTLSGLAAMLAHEIKNPLSGISGAAQLLEMSLGDSEAEMLGLIQDEVDRIRALLDRMDAFGDAGPGERRAVNIHDVLNQARVSAAAGFARHIRFREFYDPSLPALPGDRARLLQALSNLLKNAAEAAPRKGGEIVLRTAFRPGVKMIVSGGGRESLPLEVSVIDNGPGVPESLEPHIFDPFVTSKTAGTGLGLALVAKIVSDHGGVIDYLRQNGRTVFRMLFPVWQGDDGGDDGGDEPRGDRGGDDDAAGRKAGGRDERRLNA